MLDFDNEDNAVYVKIYPFENLVADKEQGMKVLEEASECREAYDQLAKISILQEESEDGVDPEMLQIYLNDFVEEACDVIQATVNLLRAVLGNNKNAQKALADGMYSITVKNANREHYGEIEEDIDDEEENDEGLA